MDPITIAFIGSLISFACAGIGYKIGRIVERASWNKLIPLRIKR